MEKAKPLSLKQKYFRKLTPMNRSRPALLNFFKDLNRMFLNISKWTMEKERKSKTASSIFSLSLVNNNLHLVTILMMDFQHVFQLRYQNLKKVIFFLL
jgi:hypothetical protein